MKLKYKDEVEFYIKDENFIGTIILCQSDKVLIACSDDLRKLKFIPIDWYTGKYTYNRMIETYGNSEILNDLYTSRIEPLNTSHLFKWFNKTELKPIDTILTLEQLINKLNEETKSKK